MAIAPEWSWLYFFEFSDAYFRPDNGVVIEKRAFDVRGNLSAPRLFASRIIKRNDWNVQKRKNKIEKKNTNEQIKGIFLSPLGPRSVHNKYIRVYALCAESTRHLHFIHFFFQFGFFFVILRQPETTLYTYIFLMRSFIGGAIHLYGNDSFTLRSHSEIWSI